MQVTTIKSMCGKHFLTYDGGGRWISGNPVRASRRQIVRDIVAFKNRGHNAHLRCAESLADSTDDVEFYAFAIKYLNILRS